MRRVFEKGHEAIALGAPPFSWLRRRCPSSLLLLAVWMLVLLGGCSLPPIVPPTPSAVPFTATPTSMPPTPTSTLPPTPSATPTATATFTPVPTPDPSELSEAARAGLAQVQAQAEGAQLVCLRYEDVDADGAPEWLALTHQPAAVPPRLDAFVLDEARSYTLEPAPPETGSPDVGLGQYATCEWVIRDVNADGVVEIGVLGRASDNKTQLHLFAWDGAAYRRLGVFFGDAGVNFVDADGDLEEEIWEGYRVQAAPSLVWYVIHTWEDGTYGWTSDRYGWYFSDRPHAYPTHAPEYVVISFYLALNDRDLPGAYDLLLPQNRPTYEDWGLGYATTVKVSVGGVHLVPDTSGAERARVAAMVTAWDNEQGVIVGRLWNVEWDTVRTDAGWRLGNATAELLETWSVTYWP